MMTTMTTRRLTKKGDKEMSRKRHHSSTSSTTTSSSSSSSSSSSTSERRKKKNSPATKLKPNEWPKEVWESIQAKLEKNQNSKGSPYHKKFMEPGKPDFLEMDECIHPSGSERIMTTCPSPTEKDSKNSSDNGIREFSVAIHRAMKFIEARKQGKDISTLDSSKQCSHLCLNSVNVTGSMAKNCCNPTHMLWEDDKTNKTRQRCPGWIWIYPNKHNNNPGDFWYPACTHNPACKRWTPKKVIKNE